MLAEGNLIQLHLSYSPSLACEDNPNRPILKTKPRPDQKQKTNSVFLPNPDPAQNHLQFGRKKPRQWWPM